MVIFLPTTRSGLVRHADSGGRLFDVHGLALPSVCGSVG